MQFCESMILNDFKQSLTERNYINMVFVFSCVEVIVFSFILRGHGVHDVRPQRVVVMTQGRGRARKSGSQEECRRRQHSESPNNIAYVMINERVWSPTINVALLCFDR